MDEQNLEVKKNNYWKYISFAIIIIVIIVLAVVIFGSKGNNAKRYTIEVGNSPSIGEVNAPVTIIEFSDFSCPYCAAASGDSEQMMNVMKQGNSGWEPAVPNIITNYVNTGKARLVFKYYPGHGAGQQAHYVGLCLNEQGLFWKFHNLAFANYESTNDIDLMKKLAQQTGANMTKLEECLAQNNAKYTQELSDEVNQARAAELSGTPTFYVNGIKMEGAIPYQDIKKVIDSELAKS